VSVGGCVCGSCKFCKPQNYTENGIVLKGREQVSDYTPTTEEIREIYFESGYKTTPEQFDLWLAKVKREAIAEWQLAQLAETIKAARGKNK
jgi:hypothetical protein